MSKASEVFKVGQNNIGYVDSDFKNEFGSEEVSDGSVLKYFKLTRNMKDSEIISEFKIQDCTLGDVLETIKNATPDMKDGYVNIFYIKGHSRVVSVGWYGGGWSVLGWGRDDSAWYAGHRAFSPATGAAGSVSSGPSGTLNLSIFCECPRCGQCGKDTVYTDKDF